MENCVIHPIPLFRTEGIKSEVLHKYRAEGLISLTNYVWFIEGTARRTLVDAGGSFDFFVKERGAKGEEFQTLDAGLKKLGLRPGDIEIIILTHLHHDHVALASKFPKAKFIVQKDEFPLALHPHPLFHTTYVAEFFKGLDFDVIDGDKIINDEISVFKTPGHSPGGQSVGVKTKKGLAVISGLCSIRENFEPSLPSFSGMTVNPPSTHVNPLDAYDSLVRIKKIADIVVPLHDPDYPNTKAVP
ncbi:MAG: N-acyl homoserine lactonase family protein [Chloroflexi bacterium]|nr:N-acyl homoserine lactonase family protein [Chloroflexota bacterium]